MMTEPNDPTRAGSPVPTGAGAQVRLSMTELETLSGKAARGAGLDWGLAEEAGLAARWLQTHGFDGAGLLLTHLGNINARPWAEIAPVVEGRDWRPAGDGPLCPIAAGTTLCDHAVLDTGPAGGAIRLVNLDCPALLVPFLSGIAVRLGRACSMEWSGAGITVAADGALALCDAGDRNLAGRADVEVRLLPTAAEPAAPAPQILRIPIDTLRGLDALAMRTTVPASEQSRQGAGAGTTDND